MTFKLLSAFPAIWPFGRSPWREAAVRIYESVVDQARQPGFYEKAGVPDTVEGRFDLLTLHMYLVLRRLKEQEAVTAPFAQTLFDIMFRNMDDSLRELGVGDLRVGKKVRELAEMFYGRAAAYETALAEKDEAVLAVALGRNILGDENAPGAGPLAAYTLTTLALLAGQSVEDMIKGKVTFPAPLATLNEATR